MIKKIFISIVLSLSLFILYSCAGRYAMVSSQKREAQEPNPLAVEYFVDGVISDLNQNFPAALLSYQEALLYDSTAPAIYLAIGKDYLMLGKQESAIRSLKRCLDLNPQEIEAREILSKIYINDKKWDLAEKIIGEILSVDGSYIEAYYDLAQISLSKNDIEKAIAMFHRVLSLQPEPNPQLLLQLGELYMSSGRFEKAAEVYQELIDFDPMQGLGYYGVGFAKEAAGDTSEAVMYYVKALEFSPELAQARAQLSRIYYTRGDWDAALRVFTEALENDSTNVVNWFEIGNVYRQKGDTTLALETFQKIKDRFPQDWRVYLDVGRIFLDKQEFSSAYHEFKKIIALSSETIWGWLFTGISLVHLDSLQQSESYLERALDLAPDDPLANYYMGLVLSQRDRPEESAPYLEKALESRPKWVSALSVLAGVYETLKEYAISDSLFQSALAVEPDNAMVLNNYSYSLAQRKSRLDEAIEMALKALGKEPENGAYLDTVGWIYFNLGEYEKALEFIHKAYSIRKESIEVADHLGEVYDKLGMRQKAREVWEEALKLDQDNQEILKKLSRTFEE